MNYRNFLFLDIKSMINLNWVNRILDKNYLNYLKRPHTIHIIKV